MGGAGRTGQGVGSEAIEPFQNDRENDAQGDAHGKGGQGARGSKAAAQGKRRQGSKKNATELDNSGQLEARFVLRSSLGAVYEDEVRYTGITVPDNSLLYLDGRGEILIPDGEVQIDLIEPKMKQTVRTYQLAYGPLEAGLPYPSLSKEDGTMKLNLVPTEEEDGNFVLKSITLKVPKQFLDGAGMIKVSAPKPTAQNAVVHNEEEDDEAPAPSAQPLKPKRQSMSGGGMEIGLGDEVEDVGDVSYRHKQSDVQTTQLGGPPTVAHKSMPGSKKKLTAGSSGRANAQKEGAPAAVAKRAAAERAKQQQLQQQGEVVPPPPPGPPPAPGEPRSSIRLKGEVPPPPLMDEDEEEFDAAADGKGDGGDGGGRPATTASLDAMLEDDEEAPAPASSAGNGVWCVAWHHPGRRSTSSPARATNTPSHARIILR